MSRSINFVRDRQRNLSRLEVQDRVMFRYALIAISIAVALVLISVGARLFLLYQLQQITDDQKRLRSAISDKVEIEKSFTVFSFKLKSLTDLFGKRKEKQETLEYFSSLFAEDVVISQLAYSAESEELTFTLKATNIFVMDIVMNTLNGSQVKGKYPRMKKSSLNRGSDGTYSMNLSIALSEKSLEAVAGEVPPDGLTDPTLNEPIETAPEEPGI